MKSGSAQLVDRVLTGEARKRAVEKAGKLSQYVLDEEKAKEVQNIAQGVFSPLDGFLNQGDYLSVLDRGRMENGHPWTIPIVLDFSSGIEAGDERALVYRQEPVAILHVTDTYRYDKQKFAEKVFGTTDSAHPGVAKLMAMKECLAGGQIDLLKEVDFPFATRYLKPSQTRELFREKGWKTVVGFQTRNIPHLGHEYCQKTALTFADGLFINPVIGKKKKGDFTDEVIIDTYDALIKSYYPPERVHMSILPLEMRYAGPREAIFHAVVRRNFGCSHIIIGRDHAGVGSYYPPFAAQEIFKQFPDLDISPVLFQDFFYCRKCLGVMNKKTCPHDGQWRVDFSGTDMRARFLRGERPSEEVMRAEVVDLILKNSKPFVE